MYHLSLTNVSHLSNRTLTSIREFSLHLFFSWRYQIYCRDEIQWIWHFDMFMTFVLPLSAHACRLEVVKRGWIINESLRQVSCFQWECRVSSKEHYPFGEIKLTYLHRSGLIMVTYFNVLLSWRITKFAFRKLHRNLHPIVQRL